MPQVSIIIPAYNKAELTCRTLESVLAQTYMDREIIVVDDGSQDQTRQAMERYGKQIQYVYKKNGGACSARNEGIRQAKGKYLAFIDCDDLYEAQKISTCIDYLERHSHFGFVHTAASFIDREDHVVGLYDHPSSYKEGWIAQRLILGNFICNSTVVVRREVLDRAGLFDESIFPPGDWDMWLRLADIAQVGYIAQPLTKYRVSDNFIFNRLEQSLIEELFVVNKSFDRNKKWSKTLFAQALSNTHLRFAQNFLIKGEISRFDQEMHLALSINTWNFKAWALKVGCLVCPQLIYKELHRRILRLG